MGTLTKRFGIWALIVAALLMIPLVLQAPWNLGDFVLAAVLLFGAATVYELAARSATNTKCRVLIAALILGVLVFVWGGLATGFEGAIDLFIQYL